MPAIHASVFSMTPRTRRLIQQLVVVVPTVAASWVLGQRGVPPLRRIITSVALGAILLTLMMAWRLTQPRSQR